MNQTRIEELQNIDEAERIRLLLEREKISTERIKTWSTAASIFVPFLIAALMVVYNIHHQAEQAKIDFQLKAAEIVMNASSPSAAANKAAVLVELFPEHLTTRFQKVFDNLYRKTTP
jgi:hypothetical protein